MIKLDNLSFSYGKKAIIKGVSANLRRGELYGIIGANGSGKTTLLKLVSGILKPDGGTLSVDGSQVTSRKAMAKKLSLMPQYRSLPDMTVWDFVDCGRFPNSHRINRNDEKIINSVLEDTELVRFKDRFLSTLSGGERQKAYLALCLAQDTEYILLDEPTTYLDIANTHTFMEILSNLKAEGKCIAAVFHDIGTALEYCDKILIMKDGVLAFSGSPEETVGCGILKDIFSVECIKFTAGDNTYFGFKKL